MSGYHLTSYGLLGIEARQTPGSEAEVEAAERRLGFRLPASVREWYGDENAIELLAKYSNQDWPIPVAKFAVKMWKDQRLLPFKYENQGVCVWAILLNGADDPPVVVDVDSNGAHWTELAPTFSSYVFTCLWDHAFVLDQPALVQAQNGPLTHEAVAELRKGFSEQRMTFCWPGSTQHRFAGKDNAILIWASDTQADWFVGARDAESLESALLTIWNLDGVGPSLYDCSEIGKAVLNKIRGGDQHSTGGPRNSALDL